MAPPSPEYNDSYSYEYPAWNAPHGHAPLVVGESSISEAEASGYLNPSEVDASHDHTTSMSADVSGIHAAHYAPHNGMYGGEPDDSAYMAEDPNRRLTEAELYEECEAPLEMDHATPMELAVLIDPLVGRDYSTGYVPSRPIDFQKSMAFLRGQLDALADTEVFDTLNAIPRPAEEANASHSGGAKTSASKNGPIQQKEARPIIRGGGGLQGPSVADAVNVDALMAELAGGPRA